MTHVAIHRFGEGRTCQCGPEVARARGDHRGGSLVVVTSVRDIAPSGVPIPGRGKDDRRSRAGRGAESRSDVQPSEKLGRCGASTRGCGRSHDQRNSNSGVANASQRSKRQWLSGAPIIVASNSNTPSTASSPSNSSRRTNSLRQYVLAPSGPNTKPSVQQSGEPGCDQRTAVVRTGEGEFNSCEPVRSDGLSSEPKRARRFG